MDYTKLLGAAVVLGIASTARGADAALKARARRLLEEHRDAVVTVKLVLSTRMIMMGREMNKRESKNEVTGTVIDPSGLTVTSNWAMDPMSAAMEAGAAMAGGEVQFKTETDVVDAKIVLADGTELPARVVLKDKDLDLAFVKPKEEPEEPLPHVSFSKAAVEPEILDDVILIGRLGRAVKRVNSLAVTQIAAIVKRPRKFYVCDIASGFTHIGCPVFTADGETLGVLVMRQTPGGASGAVMMLGGMQPVVLTSEDLLDVAAQAAAAWPEAEEE